MALSKGRISLFAALGAVIRLAVTAMIRCLKRGADVAKILTKSFKVTFKQLRKSRDKNDFFLRISPLWSPQFNARRRRRTMTNMHENRHPERLSLVTFYFAG